MGQRSLTRRESLMRALAFGSLQIAPAFEAFVGISALEAQEERASLKPTQWNEIGPFYKRLAPNRPNLRELKDLGLPLTVSGRIFNTRGEILPSAEIDIWH